MGKIIKFDPRRRRPGRGGRDTRSWTRPEDYGAPPPLPPRRPRTARRASAPPMLPAGGSPRTVRSARLAVAAIIAAGILTALLGLQ